MKDEPPRPAPLGSGMGSGTGEKRNRVKPEVPPRRNAPGPGGDKSGSMKERATVPGSKEQQQQQPGPAGQGSTEAPPPPFSPTLVSGSAGSTSSTPLPPEPDGGADSPSLGRGRSAGEGGDGGTPRPCVTFDPNPTILLSGSENSPITIGGKDGVRKFRSGRENANMEDPPTSSLKQTDELHANLEAAARMKPEEPEDCHLRDLYTQISELVVAKPDELDNVNEDEAEDPAAVPMIWISKWVDYSDKYGLGYQLSDDSIGVLFNDFTKLLLLPDGENIHYIERNGQEHYHRMSQYPESLYKKVTLLRYFRNYMNEHLLKAGATMAPRDGDELARIPSLKTYFRTRSAIVLHLTNGTLQINFFEDHTKIILCPLMGAATYIDKKRNFRTFRLEKLKNFGCSSDLGNRLRYARNMIQKLMLTKSGSSSKGGSSAAPCTQQATLAKQLA